MVKRYIVSLSKLLVISVLASTPAMAQGLPRTSWDSPDLQGVWDFRTITPMERPASLADQAFLTDEEAANLDQEAFERIQNLADRPA